MVSWQLGVKKYYRITQPDTPHIRNLLRGKTQKGAASAQVRNNRELSRRQGLYRALSGGAELSRVEISRAGIGGFSSPEHGLLLCRAELGHLHLEWLGLAIMADSVLWAEHGNCRSSEAGLATACLKGLLSFSTPFSLAFSSSLPWLAVSCLLCMHHAFPSLMPPSEFI